MSEPREVLAHVIEEAGIQNNGWLKSDAEAAADAVTAWIGARLAEVREDVAAALIVRDVADWGTVAADLEGRGYFKRTDAVLGVVAAALGATAGVGGDLSGEQGGSGRGEGSEGCGPQNGSDRIEGEKR
jgi:hypothetical protein